MDGTRPISPSAQFISRRILPGSDVFRPPHLFEFGEVGYLPHSFPVILAALFAVIPWVPWSRRFSLRTLLIATTLLAMLLGAIVYAIR